MADEARGTSAQIVIPAPLRAKLLIKQAEIEGKTGKKPKLPDLVIQILTETLIK